jgi:hypothetical protein
VIPSLVALSQDLDKSVRSGSIANFAVITIHSGDDSTVIEKIKQIFDPLTEDEAQATKIEVIKAFTTIIPHAQPDFRDHCKYILPPGNEFNYLF